MNKDSTDSTLHRQNILNNRYAISQIEQDFSLGGISYKGETVFTKVQVASILDVEERTIDRYISNHIEELSKNGYKILRTKELLEFKHFSEVADIDVGDIKTIPSLGLIG